MAEHNHLCLADLATEDREPELTDDELAMFDAVQSSSLEEAMSLADVEEYEDGANFFRVVTSVRSANYGPNPMRYPIGIMLHHTAGRRAGDLPTLTRKGTWVSANDYITKDGTIYELCPWPRRAWHAGNPDRGTGYVNDGNTYYWGIEIENLGNGSDPYTDKQIQAIIWRCKQLRQRHNIDNPRAFIRHKDFAPSRKIDTSNNFPFNYVKDQVFSTKVSPTPPVASKPQAPERVMFVYSNSALASTKKSADAAAFALKEVGIQADAYSNAENANYAAKLALDGKLGQNVLIVQGSLAMSLFSAKYRDNFTDGGKWFDKDESDVWDARRNVVKQTSWNIARLCDRAGKDKRKALEIFNRVYEGKA